MNKNTWLLEHRHNVYSQSGEDGIIESILNIISSHNNWCVEFGAHDGKTMSNTRNLIENKNYSAILIEGDKSKYKELQRSYANKDNVTTINKYVGFDLNNNLDSILKMSCIPEGFDFLSIDIDGNDYHVWDAMSIYKPKVICIEFNPTIPTNIEFIQPRDMSVNQGSSLSSIVKLAHLKGYELVSVLEFNAFFVRSEYYPLFQIENNSPEILRTNLDSITYFFQGFDGTIFLRGYTRMPWIGIDLYESNIQQVPKCFRKRNFNTIESILFNIYLLIVYPRMVIKNTQKLVKAGINKLKKML